jgi:hypothetical protein
MQKQRLIAMRAEPVDDEFAVLQKAVEQNAVPGFERLLVLRSDAHHASMLLRGALDCAGGHCVAEPRYTQYPQALDRRGNAAALGRPRCIRSAQWRQ